MPTLDHVASQIPPLVRTVLLFQRDNDPELTSQTTKQWLAEGEEVR